MISLGVMVMRAFLVILVASLVAFLFWQATRPDSRVGEPAVDAQIGTTQQDAAEDETAAVVEEETAAVEEAALPDAPVESVIAEEEEPLPGVEVLTAHTDEIVELYENARWVHRGLDGPVLYVISFRTCPTCLAFKQAEFEGLEAAGVDVRWIIYARRDREGRQRSSTEERAVQAELWLNRDWQLFERWYATDPNTFYVTSQLPPVAEEDPARMAANEEARALVDRLSDLYAENDVEFAIPTLFWRQNGEWVTYVGYEETSFAPVRAALTGHTALTEE